MASRESNQVNLEEVWRGLAKSRDGILGFTNCQRVKVDCVSVLDILRACSSLLPVFFPVTRSLFHEIVQATKATKNQFHPAFPATSPCTTYNGHCYIYNTHSFTTSANSSPTCISSTLYSFLISHIKP